MLHIVNPMLEQFIIVIHRLCHFTSAKPQHSLNQEY